MQNKVNQQCKAGGGQCLKNTGIGECRYHPFLSVIEGKKCYGCKNNNIIFLRL